MTRAQERVLDRCIPVTETGCWIWTGTILPNGYGRLKTGGRPRSAHRYSYEAFKGPIPAGLGLDHLCRVRSCVNPDHLEPVTIRENLMRSPIAPASKNFRQTHCKRGHEFTPENTYIKNRMRHCITCREARRVAWIARNREWVRQYNTQWAREKRTRLAESRARLAETSPSALAMEEA